MMCSKLCALFLLATSVGAMSTANETNATLIEAAAEELDRSLYIFDLVASYRLLFTDVEPSPPTADDMEELRRLTQVFYVRHLSGPFGGSYQLVEVDYESHEWADVVMGGEIFTDLTVNFELKFTMKEDATNIPGADEVLEQVENIETDIYVENFVHRAKPRVIFEAVNSSSIAAEIQFAGTVPPTPSPTKDPRLDQTWVPDPNAEPPLTATRPPTNVPTPTPTAVVEQGFSDPEQVIVSKSIETNTEEVGLVDSSANGRHSIIVVLAVGALATSLLF